MLITASSIAAYTPKGEYDITVQKSNDGGENWTDAGVLKFTTSNDGGSNGNTDSNDDTTLSSSGGGCNSGFTLFALGFALVIFPRVFISKKCLLKIK